MDIAGWIAFVEDLAVLKVRKNWKLNAILEWNFRFLYGVCKRLCLEWME